MQGAQSTTLLEVQRQDQEERGLAAPEHELGQQPGAERALPEQGEVEQRSSATAQQGALLRGEGEQDRRCRGQRQPRPQGPSMLAPIDERQHDRGEAGGDQHSADYVETARCVSLRLGHQRRRQRERQQSDRHVDEKAAAPAEPGHVGLYEHAAEQLSAHGGQPHHHAVDREGANAVGAGVGDADDRHHVGHHQRAGDALYEPRDDQHERSAGDAAGGRARREQGQSERERPAPADAVADPPAGDEEHGRGQAIAGHDPLDRAVRRV